MENEECTQERRALSSEYLNEVPPDFLPHHEGFRATVAAEHEGGPADHTSTTQAPVVLLPSIQETRMDTEDRLFNSPPRSPEPHIATLPHRREQQYLSEQVTMPPEQSRTRSIVDLGTLVTRVANSGISASLVDLYVVLNNAARAEAETRERVRDAQLKIQEAREVLQRASQDTDAVREVMQNTQRRIQTHENMSRVFGTREQIEGRGEVYEPVAALSSGAQGWTIRHRASQTSPGLVRAASRGVHTHSHPSRQYESRTDRVTSFGSMRAGSHRIPRRNPAVDDRPIHTNVNSLPSRSNSSVRNTHRLPAPQTPIPWNERIARNQRASAGPVPDWENAPVLTDLTNTTDQSSLSQARRGQLREAEMDRRNLMQRRRAELEHELNHRASTWRRHSLMDALSNATRDVIRNHPMTLDPQPAMSVDPQPHSSDSRSQGVYSTVNPFDTGLVDSLQANPLSPRRENIINGRPDRPNRPVSLGINPPKPPPKTAAEMTKEVCCVICYEQPATVACLPCGMSVYADEFSRC